MPRWVRAMSESLRAMAWKVSKSLLASHGGSIAGEKACTNGCMSVVDRSCFSYQVAAGKHDVGQQRRRGHPEVGADEQVELALGDVVAPGDLAGAQPRGPARPLSRWSGCRAGTSGSTRCPWPRTRAGWPATAPACAASSPARRRRRRRTSACRRSARSTTWSTGASGLAASASSARSSGLRSNCG